MVRSGGIGAALLARCGILVGCGGQSATDQVRSTITTFSQATANGDAGTACALIAPGQFTTNGSCVRAMRADMGRVTEHQQALLRAIKVISVTVTGRTAKASVRLGTRPGHGSLRDYGGHWLLLRSSVG
jgi:hypothetical protein